MAQWYGQIRSRNSSITPCIVEIHQPGGITLTEVGRTVGLPGIDDTSQYGEETSCVHRRSRHSRTAASVTAPEPSLCNHKGASHQPQKLWLLAPSLIGHSSRKLGSTPNVLLNHPDLCSTQKVNPNEVTDSKFIFFCLFAPSSISDFLLSHRLAPDVMPFRIPQIHGKLSESSPCPLPTERQYPDTPVLTPFENPPVSGLASPERLKWCYKR